MRLREPAADQEIDHGVSFPSVKTFRLTDQQAQSLSRRDNHHGASRERTATTFLAFPFKAQIVADFSIRLSTMAQSILVISRDLIYGEIIRSSYRDQSIQVYYLPSFLGTSTAVETAYPSTIILDLYKEDLENAEAFLQRLMRLERLGDAYRPSLFLSQSSMGRIQPDSKEDLYQLLQFRPTIYQQGNTMLIALRILDFMMLLRFAREQLD